MATERSGSRNDGRWSVSQSGDTGRFSLFSNDSADVELELSGAFDTDEQAKAFADRVCAALNAPRSESRSTSPDAEARYLASAGQIFPADRMSERNAEVEDNRKAFLESSSAVSASASSAPSAIYVWLVPSEQMLEQPGRWRIRKWDTEPFPEANYTLRSSIGAPVAWLIEKPLTDEQERSPLAGLMKNTDATVSAAAAGEYRKEGYIVTPLYVQSASEPSVVKAALIAASPLIKQAWADRCGIDVTDERAQEADKVGWPSDYGLFEQGWNALARALLAAADRRTEKP